MNRTILIIAVIAVSLLLSNLIRQIFLNRLSRQLYDAAYIKKDRELFEILIESPQAKLTMSDISRKIMSLNFYISIDDEKSVLKTGRHLIERKLNMQEAQTVYPAVIGYLCEKGNTDASDFLNDMKSRYGNSKDLNMMLMIYDCELTYDIYIKKNTGRIKDIEEILKTDIDPNSKAVYQYRLAKLYFYDNNRDEAKYYLNEAKNNTSDSNAKKKIDSILNGNWEHL